MKEIEEEKTTASEFDMRQPGESDLEYRDRLCEANADLPGIVVRKFIFKDGRRLNTHEDLEIEGYIAMMHAGETYDCNHESHASFRTYAWQAIYRELYRLVKKDNANDADTRRMPEDDELDGEQGTCSEMTRCEDADELHALTDKIMKEAPGSVKKALSITVMKISNSGLKNKDFAEMFGVGISTISKWMSRLHRYARKYCSEFMPGIARREASVQPVAAAAPETGYTPAAETGMGIVRTGAEYEAPACVTVIDIRAYAAMRAVRKGHCCTGGSLSRRGPQRIRSRAREKPRIRSDNLIDISVYRSGCVENAACA